MSCVENVCGTGGWAGPKPGDPSNDINIRAIPAFGGIDVLWSFPTTNPFALAYGVIFRGLSADFNGAFPVGQDTDGFYHDRVEPGVLYYYWVQAVSINGTFGDVIGPASAAAKATIEQTMRDLTAQIDMGQLALALREKIDRIAAIDLSFMEEHQARLLANQALQDVLTQLRSEVGEVATVVTNEVIQRKDGDADLLSSINALGLGLDDNLAAIVEEKNLRVGADSAMAQRIDTIYTEIQDDVAGTVNAAVTVEKNARVDADGALAGQITTLSVKMGTDISAAVQTETNARVGADNAIVDRLNVMGGKVDGNTAAIAEETRLRVDAVSAESQARNSQYVNVIVPALNAEVTNRNNAISAAVSDERSLRVSAVKAVADSVTALEANLGDDLVQAEQRMQTKIETTDGKVTAIGALYTVKMTVNGLAGGFGVYNNGSTVEGGWDVDMFWVGRTNADKIKPFIITGGVVYINDAAINKLTFSKLRADDGSVIVENGKLKAEYLQVANSAQSTSYIANTQGWSLQSNGYAEFNNVLIRGNSVFQGKGQNPSGSNFVDYSAAGASTFIKVGNNIDIRADGSGYFARGIISPPNIVASGSISGSWSAYWQYPVNPGEDNTDPGFPRGFIVYIDTGVNVSASWTTAAEDMYMASATIAAGVSAGGGITGYSDVSVVTGDGLYSAANSGSSVDNRLYIRYAFEHQSTSGSITATLINWKLVKV